MNRRNFVSNLALGTIAAPLAIKKATASDQPLFIPTPQTVEELHAAINQLFKCKGYFDRAFIVHGDQRITFVTYISGDAHMLEEGSAFDIDSYYADPKQAVASMWKTMLDLKVDIRNSWTQEMIFDNEGVSPVQAESVWWRKKPELRVSKNNLYNIRMRAAFT